MKNAYDKILESFTKTRRDTSFSPSLLDELTEEERKNVEQKIVKLCLMGDKVSYQYIDKLKYYNPIEIFTKESMKELNQYDKACIFKILYDKTMDNKYLDYIKEISKNDINAYSMLSIMYYIGEKNDEEFYNELEDISKTSNSYRELFNIRCKNKHDNDELNNSKKL